MKALTPISIALAMAAVAFPAAAQTIGANAAVVNDVQMSAAGSAQYQAARVRQRVSLGNGIRTGRTGRLQILLLDGTNFQVGGNSRMTVDRFVYDPSRSASAVGANVARGSFRFISGSPTRARPGQSGIRTPAASIGVRGTIVEGVVGEEAIRIAARETALPAFTGANAESASLIILRGPGTGVTGETPGAFDVTAAGATVAVETINYAVFVPSADQVPIGPFPMSDAGLSRVGVLLGDPTLSSDQSEIELLTENYHTNEMFDDALILNP